MLHGSIKKWGTRCEVYDHWTAQVFCPISLWQPCASLAARPERLAASRLPRYPVPGGFIWLAIDLLSRIDRIGLPGKVQLELPFWSFWFCLILLRVPRLWHCTQHCIKLGCFFFGSFQVACRVQQFCLCTSHCHSWLMMRHVNQTLVSLCVPVNGNGYDTLEIHFPPPYVGSTSTKLQY